MEPITMEPITVELTATDKAILESYKQLAAGLIDYLGSHYEIALHSLESLDHSVIEIYNGFHTGRQKGAPITDLALEMLSKIKQMDGRAYSSYFCNNRNGEPMKSTTIAIKGENDRIIGLFCINLYLNTPLSEVLSQMIPHQSPYIALSENFANDVEDIIKKAVTQTRQRVHDNPNIPHNLRNREIVAELYEKGIFNIKDAVIHTAHLLDISKNTVYMHLRNFSSDHNA